MAESYEEIIKFIKERLSNPFFVNLTVAWSVLHWDVIYITLFVSSGELPKEFLNKYEYVKSVYLRNDICYNYYLPIWIALGVTLLKQPFFFILDAIVQFVKVHRKNLIELINKSENYQQLISLKEENNKILFHYSNRKLFLFYGAWKIRKTQINRESNYFEAVYVFTDGEKRIIGSPPRNTINPIRIEIKTIDIDYEAKKLKLEVEEITGNKITHNMDTIELTYKLNFNGTTYFRGEATEHVTGIIHEIIFEFLESFEARKCWAHKLFIEAPKNLYKRFIGKFSLIQ